MILLIYHIVHHVQVTILIDKSPILLKRSFANPSLSYFYARLRDSELAKYLYAFGVCLYIALRYQYASIINSLILLSELYIYTDNFLFHVVHCHKLLSLVWKVALWYGKFIFLACIISHFIPLVYRCDFLTNNQKVFLELEVFNCILE